MKEIKFRAWNRFMKRMEATREFDAKDYPIMQFTGLKDKNGVEIYEGDIVRWKFNHHIRDNVIYWNDQVAGYFGRIVNSHNEFAEEDREDIERGMQRVTVADSFTTVIGNIYANPELLT